MSILIKGMEMPTSCFSCPLSVLNENRLFCEVTKNEVLRAKIDAECPLVPVPPHGDLVDRDEMFAEFVVEGQKTTRYKVGERWELNGEEIRRVIQRLPAIIQAEKDET